MTDINDFDTWKDGQPDDGIASDGSFDEWKDGEPITRLSDVTSFDITLESGSFTLTGTDVSLAKTYPLTLESGSFTLTGADVALTLNRAITLESGVFSLTGTDVILSGVQKFLTLESGSFTLTGADVGLKIDRAIALESGTISLTGSDVTLEVDRDKEITLESGEFTITGSDISMSTSLAVTLEAGVISLAGSDMDLLYERTMDLESGEYTLTGTAMTWAMTSAPQTTAKIIFLFTLTGDADGTTDVEIPIKSFQARMRSGAPTYLSVVIPGIDYASYISDRINGDLKVDVAYMLSDGSYERRETIIEANLEDVRIDEGPLSKSITLTGHKQVTYSSPKTLTIDRPVYKYTLNNQTRYRFAEPNLLLNPGDQVAIGYDTLTANVISYFVGARTGGIDTTMEISEV